MPMSCPIAYNYETKMTRAAFIRLCQAKSAEKPKGWSGGAKNYEPAYPQCAGCETGKLIASGKDFPAPENVEWIEISECGLRIADAGLKTVGAGHARDIKTQEMNMDAETWKPEWNIILSEVPAAELAHITRCGLKPYWHKAPGPKRTIAPCVNCDRTVKIRTYGLCGSCEAATNKLRGRAMLDALLAARYRLAMPESKQRQASMLALKRRPAARRDAPATPAGAEQPELPLKLAAPAKGDSEFILISPLAGLGERYIRLGEMMRDVRTSLGDLAAAAHELGLRININVGGGESWQIK